MLDENGQLSDLFRKALAELRRTDTNPEATIRNLLVAPHKDPAVVWFSTAAHRENTSDLYD